MTFDEMTQAVAEARRTQRVADSQVGEMAALLVGRLRTAQVSSSVLEKLKRELRDYNIHTGSWK